MKISKIIITLFMVANYPAESYNLNQLTALYANVSVAIANYFSSACINLMTASKERNLLQLSKTAKYISFIYGKLNDVLTFSEHFDILNVTPASKQCYMPLQVVINDEQDEILREKFAFHSQKSSMSGPDRENGGVRLIFLKSLDYNLVNHYFRDVKTPFDAEIIVAWINDSQVQMEEVYRVAPNFPLRHPYFGYWSLEEGLHSHEHPMPYTRRSDLEGLELRVGYVDSPPMTIKEINESKICVKGFMGEFWELLESAINASSRFNESDELGTDINQTYTGLLGELQNHVVDIAVSPLILTKDHFEIVSFSIPMVETKFQIFFQHPGLMTDIGAILLPFDADVWLSIGGWILMGPILLYYVCRASKSVHDPQRNFTIIMSIFAVFYAICGHGSEEVPSNMSSRITFFFSLVLPTILLPSYSASLISYLTIKDSVIPFTNLKEFYDCKMYSMLVTDGSYEYDLFEYGSQTDPYVQKIFERDLKSSQNLPKSSKDAVSMLCDGKQYAFFGNEASVVYNLEITKKLRERTGCLVTKMNNDGGRVSISMGFPIDSHYKGIINYQIRKLQAIGIDERIRKKYWVKFKESLQEPFTPIEIHNVFLIFLLLGIGFMIACTIFIYEFVLREKLKTTHPPLFLQDNPNSYSDQKVQIHRSYLFPNS